MTKKQVEHLLGETRDASVLSMGGSESAGFYWSDDDGNEIGVSFKDKVDAVTDKYFSPTELSFSERMQRRIKRRIRAFWP